MLNHSSQPRQHVSVIGYVLNEDRTKLLMTYHERLDQWLPATGRLHDSELPHEAAQREVLADLGVSATPLDAHHNNLINLIDGRRHHPRPYLSSDSHHVYVLEADEYDLSPFELEELYDAQWLNWDEVLNCRTIGDDVRQFAARHLRQLSTI